ncbi:MAG: hypothetical protein RLZ37_1759 [Actinomycetota bacterium]|jgi:hypothetical protein
MHPRVDVIIVRLLRASVVGLGFTVPVARDVLERLDSGHRILASAVLWSLWAIALLSVLVPASSSLTALRLAAPAHLATLVLVSIAAGANLGSIIAVALSAIVAVVSASGETGAYFVQSSAYGDEKRFPLRCPRPFLVVMVLAWLIWFSAAAVGAILLIGAAITGTVIGAILVAVAAFCCAVFPRRFHRYSKRWLVEVPAGLVIHDHVLLTETSMFPRRAVIDIDVWKPSDLGNDEPFDLSGGFRSTGIVIRLKDPETVILAPTKDHPGGQAFHVSSARVCPTRIARALTLLKK